MKITKTEKESILKIILRYILMLILILVAVYNVLYLCYNSSDKNFSFFGRTLLVVENNSMEPTLKQKDLIIMKNVSKEELESDEIIVYFYNEEYRITRIIRPREGGEIVSYLIKGDNNFYIDEILSDEVEGKVVNVISGDNFFIHILRLLGSKAITAILIIYVILFFRYKRKMRKRDRKRAGMQQFKNIM